MSPETRNMIAAMSLSLAILIGWQIYFVDPPKEQNQNLIQDQQTMMHILYRSSKNSC